MKGSRGKIGRGRAWNEMIKKEREEREKKEEKKEEKEVSTSRQQAKDLYRRLTNYQEELKERNKTPFYPIHPKFLLSGRRLGREVAIAEVSKYQDSLMVPEEELVRLPDAAE